MELVLRPEALAAGSTSVVTDIAVTSSSMLAVVVVGIVGSVDPLEEPSEREQRRLRAASSSPSSFFKDSRTPHP